MAANVVQLKIVRTVNSNASIRLRDLVRQVRATKTKAEEKAIVERELACIRVSFFDEYNKNKCRNMIKLIYINMIGYEVEFAKIECIKLIGAKDKKFPEIRTGYLGAVLLLDEQCEVHLLLTNCLRSHLSESEMFVNGLALSTLGNICSPEMCRDLAVDVSKHLARNACNFVKKKAALCAFRFVRKVPELSDIFLPNARGLLNEKYHGVLMSGIVLVTEMCELNPDMRTYFNAMVPNLCRILKNLQTIVDFSPRHTVSGICDPFLQIKILKLFRILGKDDTATSEKMKEMLSQMTISSGISNVSASILYETVFTIMKINSDESLRGLALNVIQQFMIDTDKNVRYAALSLLSKLAGIVNFNFIKLHKKFVLESLKDADISFRRLAFKVCKIPEYRDLNDDIEYKNLLDKMSDIEIGRNSSNSFLNSEEENKSGNANLLFLDFLDEDKIINDAAVNNENESPAKQETFSLHNSDLFDLLGWSEGNCNIKKDAEQNENSAADVEKETKVELSNANMLDLKNLNDLTFS